MRVYTDVEDFEGMVLNWASVFTWKPVTNLALEFFVAIVCDGLSFVSLSN